jgi:hypothetical protein|tara:strand:- start:579 stop:977 length:399 start_codon:yes stop_codon:yes gene_type:complete
MRTIEVKEINVSTKQGRLDWLEYKNNPEWSFLAETGTIALFEKIEQKKRYIITGKGYFNATVNDPFISSVEIQDLQVSYGNIEFTGTEEQLEKFLDKLIEDEASFKVTGHFEKDSKEHQYFMYGPDNIFKPE